jgi:hypothetical protein
VSTADVGPGSPRVLVSLGAFTAFSGALRQAAPAARFLVADSGGLMDGDGRPVTGEANPQAGWFSSDLFAGGRGAGWLVGHLLSSSSLRGAGSRAAARL